MNILVTAGNTLVPIDRVRCITNIFTGRTGAAIAVRAWERSHQVTLLTSHPEAAGEALHGMQPDQSWSLYSYRTFDDLDRLMSDLVQRRGLDAVIHCAAVADFRAEGIFAPETGTHFDAVAGQWLSSRPGPPRLLQQTAGKVKSDHPELWLRLVRTPKLVDRIRTDWRFRGLLVKFKLEVDIDDERLLEISEASRAQSVADLMVANTLEGSGAWAYLGPTADGYVRVSRRELPDRLLDALERLHTERGHG